jgi:hypothetical protein
MRTKLGLTESELMKSIWVYINLQMFDFPYWESKGGEAPVTGKEAIDHLDKYMDKG